MDFSSVPPELWLSQGVFCLLFVWLFYDSRKEAKLRESNLMEQIKEQSVNQGRIVQSLERMEEKINNLDKVR